MKQANDFAYDMLDIDREPDKIVYCACRDITVSEKQGLIYLDIPFEPYIHRGIFRKQGNERIIRRACLGAYGASCLRFTLPAAETEDPEEREKRDAASPMLCFSGDLRPTPLRLVSTGEDFYRALDGEGVVRMELSRIPHRLDYWSDLQPPSDPRIQLTLYPDGKTPVRFAAYDQFFPGKFESMPLAFTEGESLFSFYAGGDEHFYGTGERFGPLDLTGRTVTLENTDALGTNSRKAYKNIPFYLSSSGYGLFIHTSCHLRLSFADISNRAVQGSVEERKLDLFFLGGGKPERILYQYRRVTGFSPELPLWSYGMWMSRMTYISADQIRSIAERLRAESYPCDVLHIDTGYFETDWICEWDFSKERFPDPKAFFAEMRRMGFRVTLWQTPNIGKTNRHYPEVSAKKYLPPPKNDETAIGSLSDFSGQDHGGALDFSDPGAVAWYQAQLRRLFDYGAAAIKTDFGERIDMSADYRGMNPARLHNLYALLYQKAAAELSAEYSELPLLWSRAGWAGCQRYPLHWGGDTSATWEGLAQTLRGGLSLGLSGFTYWSHDIPGFHGLPDFMNSKPDETLYLRWTQFGVFTSHMRYHGSFPREPWEYPGVASLVRCMLRLRYALIPYIMQEGRHCGVSGRSLMAPLFFDYPDDPGVKSLDTQYIFGRDMLVAPILGEEGVRDVYLPEGDWADFFTGDSLSGPGWLRQLRYPPERFPVFVKKGAVIPLYPEPVSCTDEMDLGKIISLKIDKTFRGIWRSIRA
jgi:alpha-D-xyloside xylohydrolase